MKQRKFGFDLSYNLTIKKVAVNFWYVADTKTGCRMYCNVTSASAIRLSQLAHRMSFYQPKYFTARSNAVGYSYLDYDLHHKLLGRE